MAQQALRILAFPLIDPLTYWDLCHELVDHNTTIRWCQTLKLLPSSKSCSCGLLQILRLLHLWSTKTPVGKAHEEVKHHVTLTRM